MGDVVGDRRAVDDHDAAGSVPQSAPFLGGRVVLHRTAGETHRRRPGDVQSAAVARHGLTERQHAGFVAVERGVGEDRLSADDFDAAARTGRLVAGERRVVDGQQAAGRKNAAAAPFGAVGVVVADRDFGDGDASAGVVDAAAALIGIVAVCDIAVNDRVRWRSIAGVTGSP